MKKNGLFYRGACYLGVEGQNVSNLLSNTSI